jgi:hypothetical protein
MEWVIEHSSASHEAVMARTGFLSLSSNIDGLSAPSEARTTRVHHVAMRSKLAVIPPWRL